jgi:hypothetical protein
VSHQEQKKQSRQVIVLYDFSSSSQNGLQHAISMSKVLKAGLTLVFPLTKDDIDLRNSRKAELASIVAQVEAQHNLNVQAFAPDKPLKSFFIPLYEKIEGIMIVAAIEDNGFVCGISMRHFLSLVRKSRIPWLTVPVKATINDFNHIVLPLSYNRQTKEKIAWASYFHRLNKSAIHVLSPLGKDGFIKTGIYKNTEFLKKMYSTLEVYFKLIKTEKSIHHIDLFAVDYAVEHDAAPVIILVTPRPDIFDILFGSVERKIIMNQQNVPVLCLNPLDDMYVVCS